MHILLKQFGPAPDTVTADMPTQTDTPTADTLIADTPKADTPTADTPTAEFELLNSVKMAAQMTKTLRVHHTRISRH